MGQAAVAVTEYGNHPAEWLL